jgi:nicotinamidase-related amidase
MNGFAGTDLDLQLRQHGVQNIVLAGMTAPGCVEGSGRYALELGYSVTLVRDATAAFSKELLHAVTDLTGPFWAEAILPTADVIAAITSTSRTR